MDELRLNQNTQCIRLCAVLLLGALLNGCSSAASDASKGGGERAYTVGGTVTGLIGTVVLQNNGTDKKIVSADGSFTFDAALANQNAYEITVLTQPTEPPQTCAVTKGSGSIHSNVSDVRVNCTNTYTISVTVIGLKGTGLVLQNNNSDNLRGGPDIKTNSHLVFTTRVPSGSNYNVTVLNQPANPGQTCSVSNGTGMVGGTDIADVRVSCIYPRFAYVTNYSDDTLSMYTVDSNTGKLGSNGYVTTGGGPLSVAIHPNNKFAYVVNNSSSDISAYTINALTGKLAPIDAAPDVVGIQNFASGSNPFCIAVTPSGKYVYVINFNSNDISAYSVNKTSGELTQIPGSPFLRSSGRATYSTSITIDPFEKFLYIVNNSDNDVSAYSIDPTTGALTLVFGSPFITAGTGSYGVAIAPLGDYAFVANVISNDISVFVINPSTGMLTLIDSDVNKTGIQNFGAGKGPGSIAVDPSGRFIYAANNVSGDVSAFTLNTDNIELIPIDADTNLPGEQNFVADKSPYATAIDPSGRFTYVVNFDANDISTYSINAGTGALTSLGTIATQHGPTSIALTEADTPSAITPKYAYVVNVGSSDVSTFLIDKGNGALRNVGFSILTGDPRFIAVNPEAKFAYVANGSLGNIPAYAINANTGELKEIVGSPFTVGGTQTQARPFQITIDPSGRFAYVATGDDAISAYTINAVTGALTQIDADPNIPFLQNFSGSGYSFAIDPSGKFAYDIRADSLSALAINLTTGGLTQIDADLTTPGIQNFPAGTRPESLSIEPSGKYVYVANRGSNDISAFAINPNTGELTAIDADTAQPGTQNFTSGISPTSIVADPRGRFIYVANTGSDSISGYTINQSTGKLSSIDADTSIPEYQNFVADAGLWFIAVDPSGKFLYVSNSIANNIALYSIDSVTGNLSRIDSDLNIPGIQSYAAGKTPSTMVTTSTMSQ